MENLFLMLALLEHQNNSLLYRLDKDYVLLFNTDYVKLAYYSMVLLT